MINSTSSGANIFYFYSFFDNRDCVLLIKGVLIKGVFIKGLESADGMMP